MTSKLLNVKVPSSDVKLPVLPPATRSESVKVAARVLSADSSKPLKTALKTRSFMSSSVAIETPELPTLP